MYICVCILENGRTHATFVRNALLIRVSSRNIFVYMKVNIQLVKVLQRILVNIFITEHLLVVSKMCF